MSTVKIYGFYHCCLINHWKEIVSEQISVLVKSGLYDASEVIFIGALGKQSDFYILKEIIQPFPKIVIGYHSENIEEFEFMTLKLLREKSLLSQQRFYGYYLHTKGASWFPERNPTAYRAGTYWRKSMNHYTIERWKDNIQHLNIGYQLCGTQLRSQRTSPAFKNHYSGNFFWFNSDYVKLLRPVENFDMKNRWEAEMYICHNFPLAATLNQEWIDYNTNKVWEKT